MVIKIFVHRYCVIVVLHNADTRGNRHLLQSGFFGRDECVTDKNLIADTVQNGGKRVTVYR